MTPDQAESLSQYSTMGLGGKASYAIHVKTKDELREAIVWAKDNDLESIVIGSGSNIVWRDEGFSGLLIINEIAGFTVDNSNGANFYITAGAGEIWDEVVKRSCEMGLSGIEALSLIPGKAGAVPIQNVGAYGQEISSTLISVEAFDSQSMDFITIGAKDCGLGYRTSRFKTTDKGRYYISSIKIGLTKGSMKPPFYKSLESYLNEHGISDYSPESIRNAVIAIRRSKLPDPAVVRNCGSFFANPVISKDKFKNLQDEFSDIPHWPEDNEIKLSAAWLIEQAGFKNYHDSQSGMATWPTQPLVLINEKASSTADLLAFKQKITDAVRQKFKLELEQEPELLP